MGAAMFYPRTSLLPTIKTSLPSSINCLTNHPLDGSHQSRFHEHNHCWLGIVRHRRKEIYLFDEKPPLLQWSGCCPGTIHRRCFSIFTIFCSNVTLWHHPVALGRKAGSGGFQSFALFQMSESFFYIRSQNLYLSDVRIFFISNVGIFFVRCRNLSEARTTHQCQSGGVAAPLLLLSRPPYIAAGKQMSGHKYAHKLQGKKTVGGAVGVASTVRTAPRISYV